MKHTRSGVCLAVAFTLALLGGPGSRAAAQAAPEPARAKKSVHGTLESVNTRLNGLFMTLEDGKRLAWQLNAAVIAEVEKMKPGSPMIVIYRQITATEKRVTAVAFPGTAKAPTYLNLTGERVALRSAPMVDGACSPTAAPVQETTIPTGGIAEVVEGCWCCVAAGEACTPANKSGVGRALLVGCFE